MPYEEVPVGNARVKGEGTPSQRFLEPPDDPVRLPVGDVPAGEVLHDEILTFGPQGDQVAAEGHVLWPQGNSHGRRLQG
jgi:hypothetical protein